MKQAAIKTIDELAAWLTSSKPRAVVVIAQSSVNSKAVNFIVVGADKVAGPAFVAGGAALVEFMSQLDPKQYPPDAPSVPRGERRRMERRR